MRMQDCLWLPLLFFQCCPLPILMQLCIACCLLSGLLGLNQHLDLIGAPISLTFDTQSASWLPYVTLHILQAHSVLPAMQET